MPATHALAEPAAPYIAELEREAVSTRKLLDRLPADRLGWRPHPKSQTLGQLALHVARIPGIVNRLLATDTFDSGAAGFPSPQPADVAEIRRTFDESIQGATTMLSAWSERDLATIWRFQRDGKDLMAVPKAAALRSLVLSHGVHHRGQLTVYLRLLDVPLPAIYGPSADENPFAPPKA